MMGKSPKEELLSWCGKQVVRVAQLSNHIPKNHRQPQMVYDKSATSWLWY